jgi:hypothetical protein
MAMFTSNCTKKTRKLVRMIHEVLALRHVRRRSLELQSHRAKNCESIQNYKLSE